MEGVSEFIFEGVKVSHDIPYISAIKATKLIRQGCQGFLASVLDTTRTDIKIETIPVMNEFLDVFLEDLPGLPPNRDVEFTINMIPDTASISKVPYRMAPAEMKQLKTQLQELLDKDFIRPKPYLLFWRGCVMYFMSLS